MRMRLCTGVAAVLCVTALASAQLDPSVWPAYGANRSTNRLVLDPSVSDDPAWLMAWNTTLDSQPTPAAIRCGSYGAPVIDSDGYVYFKTNGATAGTCWLYKFNPLTGAVVAQANLGADVDGNRSAPIITTDYVFAANRVTNDIKVFNKADLTPRALVPVITNAVIPPGSNGFRGIAMATVNNTNGNPNIYGTRRDTSPNTVHAFDSVTGALMWTWTPPPGTPNDSLGQMGPFWTDGGQQCFTIVFGAPTNSPPTGWTMIALQDGGGNLPPTTLWSCPFAENSIMGNGALSPDGTRIYLGSDGATVLRALDRATGALIWSVPSSETLGGNLIPSPAVVDTPTGPRIYIGCRGNHLNVIDDLGAGYNVAWKMEMGQWMETSGLAVTKNSTTGRTYVYVTTEGYAPNPAAVATFYSIEDQGATGVVLAERVIENLGQSYSAPSICATATGEIYCTSRAAGFFKFLPAPIPTGACCLPSSTCDVRSEYSCAKAGGAYIGEDSSCDPDPCLGACCIEETGECSLTYPLDCDGTWHGDWTTCDPNPCPQPPTGACCFDDGQCLVGVTQYYCEVQQGGLWQGADTTCVPNPCHERGACCLPGRCCQDAVIKEDCIAAGGTFMGPYTQCSSVQCPGNVAIDFETPRYALGDVAGQECWVLRGGPSASAAVITGDSGPSGEGGDSQCLELSNAAGDIRVDRLFQDVIGGGGVLTYQYDRKGMPTGAWFYDSSPQGPWMPSWWSPGSCQWYGKVNHDKSDPSHWQGGEGFPSMEDGQWHTLKYKLVYGDPDGENSGELISITVDGVERLVLSRYMEDATPVSFFDVSLSPGWDGVRDDLVRVDNYVVIGEPYPSVPTAEAGPDGAASFGDTIRLDASGSSTTNGATIDRYRWVALAPGQEDPEGVVIYDGPNAVVDIGACFSGSYTFLLQVFDSNQMRDTDTAAWTIGPAPLVNPVIIDFEEASGYTAGPLIGQECWAGGGAGTSSVISGDNGPALPGVQCADLTNIGYSGQFYRAEKSFGDLLAVGPLVMFKYDYKGFTQGWACLFFPQLTGMAPDARGIGHWHTNWWQWMGSNSPNGGQPWANYGSPFSPWGEWHTFRWILKYSPDEGGIGRLLSVQVDNNPPIIPTENYYMRNTMVDIVDKCMLTITDGWDGNNDDVKVDNIVVRAKPYSDIGACCVSDGTCQDMTEADCVAAPGLWQGLGITCAEDWDGNPVVCPLPAPSDLCVNAIAVAVPSVTLGDTTWATASAPEPPECGWVADSPDVWYSLTGNGYSMTASLCDSPVIWDSQIAVYSGNDCDNLACIGASDDDCPPPPDWAKHGFVTWDSLDGQKYYVRIRGWSSTGFGPFTLTVTTAIPTGACCRGATCTIETQAECEVGGTYQGDGGNCFPYPCGPTPMAYWYDSTNTDEQGSTGSAWIEYPQPSGPSWYNTWWSNEFDLDRQKRVELTFTVQFAGPAPIVAVNYARADYTEPQYYPPIDLYIVRVPVDPPVTLPGTYTFSTLLPFCPTWVSVDVMNMGGDFTIEGTIIHECLTLPTTGACCLPPQTGHPVIPCVEVTQAECQAQGGVFVGVGTVCNPVPTACYGDADCSGAVNFDDINYFVAALAGGEPGWSGYYASKHGGTPPPCSFWNCDANGSGRCDTPQAPEVNFDDINPFVAELVTPPVCP